MSILELLREKNPLLAFELQLEDEEQAFCFEEAFIETNRSILLFDGIEWGKAALNLKGKRAIFLESSLSKLRYFLRTEEGKALLLNDEVMVYHTPLLDLTLHIDEVELISKKGSSLYQQSVTNLIESSAILEEKKHYRRLHLQNVLFNIRSQSFVIDIASVRQSLQRLPFIIVGSGPSLSLPLLKELHNRAIILSCGSATKRLIEGGIRPDFSVAIDPKPNLTDYEEDSIPLFYQGRLNPAVLRKKRGPLILVGTTPLYPQEKTFYEQAKLEIEVFDPGYDAATFAIQIAKSCEAASISLMGVDHNREYSLNDFFASRFLQKETFLPIEMLDHLIEKPLIKWQLEKIDHQSLENYLKEISFDDPPILLEALGIAKDYLENRELFYELCQDIQADLIEDEEGHLRTVQKEGATFEYYKEGKIKRLYAPLLGLDQIYSEEGVLLDEIHFCEGKPQGFHRMYNNKGELLEEINYYSKELFHQKVYHLGKLVYER